MKQILFTGWNGMRIIRMVLGLVILVQGIVNKETSFLLGGLFLTVLPLLNVGCCGSAGCYTSPKANTTNEKQKDVEYEEVVP